MERLGRESNVVGGFVIVCSGGRSEGGGGRSEGGGGRSIDSGGPNFIL